MSRIRQNQLPLSMSDVDFGTPNVVDPSETSDGGLTPDILRHHLIPTGVTVHSAMAAQDHDAAFANGTVVGKLARQAGLGSLLDVGRLDLDRVRPGGSGSVGSHHQKVGAGRRQGVEQAVCPVSARYQGAARVVKLQIKAARSGFDRDLHALFACIRERPGVQVSRLHLTRGRRLIEGQRRDAAGHGS